MSDVVEKAERFATKAHAGQFLKNSKSEPFIEHPRRVVNLVKDAGGDDDELAAAWLHDIVEDTPVTIEEIIHEFGETIADMVDGLTDPPKFNGHPSNIRKKWQAERVKDKSRSVKMIKIADQTVNIHLMGFDPPVGWSTEDRRTYLEGAKWIVDECRGINQFLENKFYETYKEIAPLVEWGQ